MDKRESLGSRLGFILLSAGCAIGLGNVWTFPWRTGNNGGAAFVLLYILAVIILGLPVMSAEFSIGRAAQKSPVLMHQALPNGKRFGFNGVVGLLGNILLMMFYTTIAGFFFYYFIKFISGTSQDLTWAGTLANTPVNIGFNALVVILGFVVLSFNLQKGVEKVSKIMMCLLFVLLIVMAVHCLTLDNAKEGLEFYLKPDFSVITGRTVIAAMNQAFFSLGLGMGSMAIFGSYINKDRSLLGESINVVALDTGVALLAGFIIFPSCFSYGISPDAGPELLFTTMAAVFNNIKGGLLWGSLFFIFMMFAAMSTVFAVFENIEASIRDLTHWSRKKGSIICCIGMLILTLPMALSGNVLANFQVFSSVSGTGVLDFIDYIVETLIQPFGSIIYLIFITSDKFGWGFNNFLEEANAGKGAKVKPWMKVFYTYITPIIVIFLWAYGIITFSY